MFETKEALIAHIQALPGYKPPLQWDPNVYEETVGDKHYICQGVFYPQEVGKAGKLKSRRAVVHEVYQLPDNTLLGWELGMEHVSETDEGVPQQVPTYGGPNEYCPWIESIFGHMERDGSDGVLVSRTINGVTRDYYKKSFIKTVEVEFGFQNICACWSRCNEGDFVDIAVDVPDLDAQGIPVGTYHEATRLASNVTIFGTNAHGTVYPPDTSPAMSWTPPGCRIRVDFYKLATNDADLASLRGPFVDVDIIGQRRRA